MSLNPNTMTIRRSGPPCGRLIALSANDGNDPDASDQFTGDTIIYFPSLPDEINLARKAEYTTVQTQFHPDGIHFYKNTSVLIIPFTFKLSVYDVSYCPYGSATLLAVAAHLHAMGLPISGQSGTSLNTGSYNTDSSTGLPTEAVGNQEQNVQGATTNNLMGGNSQGANLAGGNNISAPATCRLELLYSTSNGPGIVCTGYITNFAAKLKGPYLQGPDGAYNLPTAADYSFDFVHHPAHGNVGVTGTAGGTSAQDNAFAGWVNQRLYNTVGLLSTQDPGLLKGSSGLANAPGPVSF